MTTTIPDITNLSSEQKLVLLRTLLSEFTTADQKAVDFEDGTSAYFLGTQEARRRESEEDYRNASPEYLAELSRRAKTAENSFTVEEFLKEVNS